MTNEYRGEQRIKIGDKEYTLVLKMRDIAALDAQGVDVLRFSQEFSEISTNGSLSHLLESAIKIYIVASHDKGLTEDILFDWADDVGLYDFLSDLGPMIGRLTAGKPKPEEGEEKKS